MALGLQFSLISAYKAGWEFYLSSWRHKDTLFIWYDRKIFENLEDSVAIPIVENECALFMGGNYICPFFYYYICWMDFLTLLLISFSCPDPNALLYHF